MGSETLGNRYQIISPKYRGVSPAKTICSVYLETNGAIKYNGTTLGTASTDKYTKITMDVSCNETDVTLYLFVDGVLKHTAALTDMPWASPSEYYFNDVAFAAGYTGVLTNMKENELYIKSVSVHLTEGYNSGNHVSSPFVNNGIAEKTVGFVENAGITRYYNDDGSFKKEDFTVDGVKYLVGYNGIILGHEEDGLEMSYADYFESKFTYGTDTNVKLGESLNASAINTDVLRYARAACNNNATIGGKGSRYYASYVNTKATSQDSYWDFGTNVPKNDATVVFDFDIMLDQYKYLESYGASGLVTTKGRDASGTRPGLKADTVLLTVTSDGWLKSGDKNLVPLSKREFTKISAVVTVPETGKNNGTFDIYVNGVLMIEDAPLNSEMYGFAGFRCFQSNRQNIGMYLKNISIYKNADRPMQFRTMEGGEAVLTNDQSKTPVKASELKQGVVMENGVARYYDALGLPIVSGTVTVDETEFSTNENGKIVCGELNHLGPVEKGICSYCGKNADGVSALYGNSLIIGSDISVVFYLDIIEEKAEGASVEIGRESDFVSGNTVVTALSDIETETIDGKKYYKISYGVPAKDISDIIKARVVKADGTAGGEFTYSVKTYIDTVMAKETSVLYPAELKELLSALEIYGNNASAVLDKLPENTVTVNDADIDWTKVTDAGGSRSEDKAIKLSHFSLELKSNVKLRVYFSFNATALAKNFTAKVDGETVNATKMSSSVWCIEHQVPAALLNDTVEFTVTSGESTLTVDLSALYYAKVMSEKAETEVEKNLMKAIYKYWEKADVYAMTLNALTGKKIYSFGDSLVAGHYSKNGMLDGITKAYGMDYTKYAQNGATVNLSGKSVYNQVLNASAICPDFVVFDGLTNDVGAESVGLNYPLGAITEGFDGEFDTTTFCGSFEATVKLMKEKYSYAKIVFVTPHKMPTRHLDYFKQLVDLAIEMCEKWDITVANVYYDGEMDTTVDELRVKYSYNNEESEGNGNGTHLTGAGYDIYYAAIICKAIIDTPAPLGVTVSEFKGASVYSFGDSLIDGKESEGYGMLYEIVDGYGLDYTEYAFRGSAINIHNADQTKVVYNQLTAADNGSPDYIIFNGLTNDVSNITESSEIRLSVGTISDGFDAELDTTTFCGSFETILRLMKEKYPTAKIIYVTPHNMATKNADGMRVLVDVAIQICEKWGITVADVYNDSGLDLNDEDMKTMYSVDGCHLNKLGYETFYVPLITEKMLELAGK